MGRWGELRARVRKGTRAAIEQLRRPGVRAGPVDANILAISDLHLGHDLKRGAATSRPARQDGPLSEFLDHYAHRPENGLRWRLVVAGDMVDFIGMTVTPAPGEAVDFVVTPEEESCGLGPEPLKAVWKLGKVVGRHPRFIDRLAHFVAVGHELVVIRGNHDQEWTHPEVREAFVEALLERAHPRPLLGADARKVLENERESMRRRIRFCDWFHLEPGRVYIEHGHLHDEFCASHDALPAADGGGALREPISTLALRLFGNHYTTLDLNEVERWHLGDFVRWGMGTGRFWRTLLHYAAMCARVISFSVRASVRTFARSVKAVLKLGRIATEDAKLARLKALLKGLRDDHEELARDLAGLLRPPAEQSVLACLQFLYVDRFLLAIGALAGIAGCAASTAPGHLRAGGLVMVLMAAVAANALLGRGRLVDSHPKLIRVAHRLAVLFGVDTVVMGHSHRLVDEAVGDGARYVNLGTWLAPSREGSLPPTFPHLVIGQGQAELRRWPAADGGERSVVA